PNGVDRVDNVRIKLPDLLPEFDRRNRKLDLRVHPKRQRWQPVDLKPGIRCRGITRCEDLHLVAHGRELVQASDKPGDNPVDFGQENFRDYCNTHSDYALSDSPDSASAATVSCSTASCSGTPACCAEVHRDCAGILERSTRSEYLRATSSTSCKSPS